jgi:hypothetical protein
MPTRKRADERERETGGHLDAHADRHRPTRRAQARAGARRQEQRSPEEHHRQRVVVRASNGQHQQHGIQTDECRGPSPGAPEAAGRSRDQRDAGEARRDRQCFHHP